MQSKNPFIQKGQSGECTETASVQTISPDAESVEYKNLSASASEVSSGNTRSDLRRRYQRCVIEDANEDSQSALDEI